MGYGNWSDDVYQATTRTYSSMTRDEIFDQDTINADMNPKGLKFRESRDSEAHPNSLAIMVWLDVTGSMGAIPEIIAREKMQNLMNVLINNGVQDAHVLFGGIGDHISDSAPLQVGQFEAGTEELNKWLKSIYIEQGGGGQNMESYLLAWLVAGRHTSIDCFEKRGQKGFLFTIGDEACHSAILSRNSRKNLKELMGYAENFEPTDKQLLEEAQRMYHVFHIHVQEGSYRNDKNVLGYWKDMLNERLIILEDYNEICEAMASIVAVTMGADINKVFDSIPSTSLALRKTVTSVTNSIKQDPALTVL